MKNAGVFLAILVSMAACRTNEHAESNDVTTDSPEVNYAEQHRPQFHFTPAKNWMNDPNGMVFHNGDYHLFYQHYPEGLNWGPMHWGHAVSKDLVHWEHLPIALYPDSLGYIFSGSAVVDEKNTSGLGKGNNAPLVAIFTYHDAVKEKAGAEDFQTQGIAFSNDNGRTWEKYNGNPVLKNQGIRDFRDPKVFWHAASQKWVMVLAVKDHNELWGSPDLKTWSKLSEFGKESGAHGGVWECPDLFELKIDNETSTAWVMISSINPGGPNGGSATQYFTGNFDGTTFSPDQDNKTIKWIDHGPDNYAGVTWASAPDNRKVFLGWMSNWAYAGEVPTSPWRSANTLPRDLSLSRLNGKLYVRSVLSPEADALAGEPISIPALSVADSISMSQHGVDDASQSLISGTFEAKDFQVQLMNKAGQRLVIGYDAAKNTFYIDRGESGVNTFSKNFRTLVTAPRIANSSTIRMTVAVDVSSVEVFFDDGLSVLTALYFPDEKLTDLVIKAPRRVQVRDVSVRKIKSIWQ